LKLGIYRKPTTTDFIVHNHSCHPYEHKKAAINCLINGMNKYTITHNNKNMEETIIRTMLHNTNYPQNIIQHEQKPPEKSNKQEKRKRATFTFFGLETRTITKLFKNTEIGISYRTKNNIKHLLRIKENNNRKYNLSGVYQLQCADCPRKYIGQTGRTFKIRFKEHIRRKE
jgi:hypothetical protein